MSWHLGVVEEFLAGERHQSMSAGRRKMMALKLCWAEDGNGATGRCDEDDEGHKLLQIAEKMIEHRQ